MAKGSKNAPAKPSQQITSFFARMPSSSQGSTASVSASGRPRLKGEAPAATALLLIDDPENPFISKPVASGHENGSGTLSQRQNPDSKTNHKADKSVTNTAKRERSSTMQPTVTNSHRKVSGDKGVSSQEIVTTSSRKKPRLSSPASEASTVPSSQSDECELTSSTQVPLTSAKVGTPQAVKHWRMEAQPPTPAGKQSLPDDMDVDESETLSGRETPTSEWTIDLKPGGPSSSEPQSPEVNQVLTPPYTDDSSDDVEMMPEIPAMLDSDTKTQRIIEEIKARAYAKACSSPEPDLEVPDELDDSSDEDDLLPMFTTVASKSPDVSTGPRRSSRHLQQAPLSTLSRDGSPTPRATRNAGASSSKVSLSPKAAKPIKPARNSVLEALLKEKTVAEKRGKGVDAFRNADSLVDTHSMIDEITLEDIDDDDWDNDTTDDVRLKEADRKKFFGNEDGKEINGILEHDSEARRHEEDEARGEGVELWSQMDGGTMMVDNGLPSLRYTGNSPTLRLLSAAIQQAEYAKATFIMKSGVFSAFNFIHEPDLLDQFCRLALVLQMQALSEATFHAILQILDREGLPVNWQLSSKFITETILKLGAQRSALETSSLPLSPTIASENVSVSDRDVILYRMITIVNYAAKRRRFPAEEVPDVVVALLLIALDPSTTTELRRDISAAINFTCHRLAAIQHRDLEIQLTSRLAGLAEPQLPVNKTLLLSFFFSGTGNTLRIARFLAYTMLMRLPSDSVDASSYRDPPSLSNILTQLVQPKLKTTDVPDSVFVVHNETDYSSMKHYLYILGVAMSNIKGCVEEQKRAALDKNKANGTQPGSPTKHGKKKPETPLQLLHIALEDLHAEIDDVRASHLDRSRAKSVAKTLQMRIHYQRLLYEKAWKDEQTEKASVKSWLSRAKPKI